MKKGGREGGGEEREAGLAGRHPPLQRVKSSDGNRVRVLFVFHRHEDKINAPMCSPSTSSSPVGHSNDLQDHFHQDVYYI